MNLEEPIKVDQGAGSLEDAIGIIKARVFLYLAIYDSVYITFSNTPPEEKQK